MDDQDGRLYRHRAQRGPERAGEKLYIGRARRPSRSASNRIKNFSSCRRTATLDILHAVYL